MVSFRRLWLLTWYTVRGFLDDHCPQMAAAISYYVLFSLFPLVIFSIGILGFVLQDHDIERRLIEELTGLLPVDADGAKSVEDAVHELSGTSSGILGLVGLAGLAWAASAMFAVIRRSLDIAFDLSGHRPFIRQKITDVAMMAVFGSIFLISFGVTTTIRVVRQATEDARFLDDLAGALGYGWDVLGVLVPAVISFLAFTLLYWLVPAKYIRLQSALPGALFAAILFEIAKQAFGFYLSNFATYDVVFGSLGALVAFLFLVFLSANILLLGAELSAIYPAVMRGEYDPTEGEGGRPPLGELARTTIRRLIFYEDPPPRPDPKPPPDGAA